MEHKEPARILVFGMTENPGGTESFLMNYYRHMDRDKIQFDFLANTLDNIAYEEELTAYGSRVFHIPPRRQNRSAFYRELDRLFHRHANEWYAIWVNVSSLANIDYLKAAKKYGIKKRIIHSHNSQNMDSKLRACLHLWNRTQVAKYATDFWACSEDAAKWFYTPDLMKQCIIVRNAIDTERVRFDEEKRTAIRTEYGWPDKFVIGNVGRLHFQKNQKFIIDIFQDFHAGHPDSVLVLVGHGEDETALKEQAKNCGLTDSVFFAGVQSDIQAWLSAFDFFLFPSKFEGLGIAALEAEANGLPVLASERVIPAEVKMNENLVFFPLDAGAEAWAARIAEMQGLGRLKYVDAKNAILDHGYDIETEVRKLENALLSEAGEANSED